MELTVGDFVAIFNIATPAQFPGHGYGAAITAVSCRTGWLEELVGRGCSRAKRATASTSVSGLGTLSLGLLCSRTRCARRRLGVTRSALSTEGKRMADEIVDGGIDAPGAKHQWREPWRAFPHSDPSRAGQLSRRGRHQFVIGGRGHYRPPLFSRAPLSATKMTSPWASSMSRVALSPSFAPELSPSRTTSGRVSAATSKRGPFSRSKHGPEALASFATRYQGTSRSFVSPSITLAVMDARQFTSAGVSRSTKCLRTDTKCKGAAACKICQPSSLKEITAPRPSSAHSLRTMRRRRSILATW